MGKSRDFADECELKKFKDTLAYESELKEFGEVLKGKSFSKKLYAILKFNFVNLDINDVLGEVDIYCPLDCTYQSMRGLMTCIKDVLYKLSCVESEYYINHNIPYRWSKFFALAELPKPVWDKLVYVLKKYTWLEITGVRDAKRLIKIAQLLTSYPKYEAIFYTLYRKGYGINLEVAKILFATKKTSRSIDVKLLRRLLKLSTLARDVVINYIVNNDVYRYNDVPFIELLYKKSKAELVMQLSYAKRMERYMRNFSDLFNFNIKAYHRLFSRGFNSVNMPYVVALVEKRDLYWVEKANIYFIYGRDIVRANRAIERGVYRTHPILTHIGDVNLNTESVKQYLEMDIGQNNVNISIDVELFEKNKPVYKSLQSLLYAAYSAITPHSDDVNLREELISVGVKNKMYGSRYIKMVDLVLSSDTRVLAPIEEYNWPKSITIPTGVLEVIRLGDEVESCQVLGGLGESCIIDSLNKSRRSFNIVYRDNNGIVATSWMWSNDDDYIVIDSVETPEIDDITGEYIAGLLTKFAKLNPQVCVLFGKTNYTHKTHVSITKFLQLSSKVYNYSYNGYRGYIDGESQNKIVY